MQTSSSPGKRNKTLLLAAAGVLALVLIIGAVLFYSGNDRGWASSELPGEALIAQPTVVPTLAFVDVVCDDDSCGGAPVISDNSPGEIGENGNQLVMEGTPTSTLTLFDNSGHAGNIMEETPTSTPTTVFPPGYKKRSSDNFYKLQPSHTKEDRYLAMVPYTYDGTYSHFVVLWTWDEAHTTDARHFLFEGVDPLNRDDPYFLIHVGPTNSAEYTPTTLAVRDVSKSANADVIAFPTNRGTGDNHQWKLKLVDAERGLYQIISKSSEQGGTVMCLDIRDSGDWDGAALVQNPCNTEVASQLWGLHRVSQ